MSKTLLPIKFFRNCVFLIYVIIVLVATTLDLLGDRSFGLMMLSSLPIACLALGCLLIGPWLISERKARALKNWLIGVALIFLITFAFSNLGNEQAKAGELIFTYAALIFAFPASLVLPFVMTLIGSFIPNIFWIREVVVLSVCLIAGIAEWQVLSWLYSKIMQRRAFTSTTP